MYKRIQVTNLTVFNHNIYLYTHVLYVQYVKYKLCE